MDTKDLIDELAGIIIAIREENATLMDFHEEYN